MNELGDRRWVPAVEVVGELREDGTGLADELRETLTETTDDLRW